MERIKKKNMLWNWLVSGLPRTEKKCFCYNIILPTGLSTVNLISCVAGENMVCGPHFGPFLKHFKNKNPPALTG